MSDLEHHTLHKDTKTKHPKWRHFPENISQMKSEKSMRMKEYEDLKFIDASTYFSINIKIENDIPSFNINIKRDI